MLNQVGPFDFTEWFTTSKNSAEMGKAAQGVSNTLRRSPSAQELQAIRCLLLVVRDYPSVSPYTDPVLGSQGRHRDDRSHKA